MSQIHCSQKNIAKDYTYRIEIEIQVAKSIHSLTAMTPNFRIIVRTAARLLRLNLLQSVMLGWLLRESNIKGQDILHFSEGLMVFAQQIDNSLFLIILINGFYVKTYLTAFLEPAIDQEILAMVPHFRLIYNSWSPLVTLSKLSLSRLNDLFKVAREPKFEGKKDYNQMVVKILELSKSYNIGGNIQARLKKAQLAQQKPKGGLEAQYNFQNLMNNPISNQIDLHYQDEDVKWQSDSNEIKLLKPSQKKCNMDNFTHLGFLQNIFDSKNSPNLFNDNVINFSNNPNSRIKQTFSFLNDI